MKYKKSLTKKYLKHFMDMLEYIRDEVFEGGTIQYNNNAILAMLLDIEYDDELITKAIRKLEDDRRILAGIEELSKDVHPPFMYFIDIIPF